MAAAVAGAPGPPVVESLDALLSGDDVDSSMDEGDLITEEELKGPLTDELARRLAAQEARDLRRIQQLRRQKKRLKVALASYKQKEKHYVARMDEHMDEVERAEQELTQRIEALTAENQALRELNETRARDNADRVATLNETTKQCGESETRVQFLVDRIVALLNASAADPAQTEMVKNLRERERDMLRQLEETRQQFDEVRQQNGEITSRLTEELSLSKRLSEQLAEVEERFLHRHEEGAALPRSPTQDTEEARSAPRLGARPLGLRADSLEAPPARPERAHPPDLPEPIPEGDEEEGDDGDYYEAAASSEPARRTLGAALEAEAESSQCEFSFGDFLADPADTGSGVPSLGAFGTGGDAGVEGQLGDGGHRTPPLVCEEEDLCGLHPDGANGGPAASWLASGAAAPPVSATPPLPNPRSALMENKLRDALEKARFECSVSRFEPGVYDFGPDVRAVLELTDDEEVVASRDGGPFEHIDDFISAIVAETRQRGPSSPAAEDMSLHESTLNLSGDLAEASPLSSGGGSAAGGGGGGGTGPMQPASAWLSASATGGTGTPPLAAAEASRQRFELMEEKLKEALDRAAFECAVTRVEPGVYAFGPSVHGVVRLTDDEEVVVSRNGGPPQLVDDFIRNLMQAGVRSASEATVTTTAGTTTEPDGDDREVEEEEEVPPSLDAPALPQLPAPSVSPAVPAAAAVAAATAATAPAAARAALSGAQGTPSTPVAPAAAVSAAVAAAVARAAAVRSASPTVVAAPARREALPPGAAATSAAVTPAAMASAAAATTAALAALTPGQFALGASIGGGSFTLPVPSQRPAAGAAVAPAASGGGASGATRAPSPAPLAPAARYVASLSPRGGVWQRSQHGLSQRPTAPAATTAGAPPVGQSAPWTTVPSMRSVSPVGEPLARPCGAAPCSSAPPCGATSVPPLSLSSGSVGAASGVGPLLVAGRSHSTTPERSRGMPGNTSSFPSAAPAGIPPVATATAAVTAATATVAAGQHLSPRPQAVAKAASPRLVAGAAALAGGVAGAGGAAASSLRVAAGAAVRQATPLHFAG